MIEAKQAGPREKRAGGRQKNKTAGGGRASDVGEDEDEDEEDGENGRNEAGAAADEGEEENEEGEKEEEEEADEAVTSADGEDDEGAEVAAGDTGSRGRISFAAGFQSLVRADLAGDVACSMCRSSSMSQHASHDKSAALRVPGLPAPEASTCHGPRLAN